MESLGFLIFLIGIVVSLAIFILCREIVCWYFKYNRMVQNQEIIIQLLNRIVENQNNINVPRGSQTPPPIK